MPVIDPEWAEKEKAIDPHYEGSASQQLGLSKFLCPTCKANLYPTEGTLICLNACHLTAEARARFSATLVAARRLSSAFENTGAAAEKASTGFERAFPKRKRRPRHKRSHKREGASEKTPYQRRRRRMQ